MFVEGALHGDGLIDVDSAGSGGGIEVEVGLRAEVEMDAAGPGVEAPLARRSAAGIDGPGACGCADAAFDAREVDCSGAGARLHIAGGGDGQMDAAGAGGCGGGSVDVLGM